MNIVIVGLGQYFQEIESNLLLGNKVVCYIDNNKEKQKSVINGKQVLSPYKINGNNIDYFIIASFSYESIREQLINIGIDENKIISYFDDALDFYAYREIFQCEKAIVHSMQRKISFLNMKIQKLKSDNEIILDHFTYEIADKIRKGEILLPQISSIEETLRKIAEEHMSISRYGDGEFQIILGHAKDKYQDNNKLLSDRLCEILVSNLDNHIVGLADDYGSVDIYGEKTRNDIRKYMTETKRRQHYQFIDMNKQYYNAYISRPYVYYPKEKYNESGERFDKLKLIWKDRDIVIIEGEKTRMGVGNDLFSETKSVERILAPSENAFSVYDRILQSVLYNVDKDKQILIALGPTATVLAYDLALYGYWAIDLGHVDLEYEWYLRGKGKCYIPYKYNNEVIGGNIVADIKDKEYEKTIIDIIKMDL